MPQQIEVPGMGVVEFPDGMKDEEIAAAIKANTPAPVSTTADVLKSGGVGVGKGFIGLAGLPGDLAEYGARGIDAATRFIGDKIGVEVQPRVARDPTYGSADITKAIEDRTGAFYKPQTTAGKYAETIGEFAPGLIGGPSGLARRAITQVAIPGAASEAAGQATEGTKAEPYARVAAAIAAGVAPSALGRVITPAPASDARQRLVDILNKEGVTSLTAGQKTGNEALRYAESAFGNAPFAGGKTNAVTRAGQEEFTQAAMRRAGGGENAGPEVLAANQKRLGDEFKDLSARNTLVMDPQFGNDVGKALTVYDKVPPSQQKAIVQGYADDIITHAQNGGTMPGAFYQEMRSRLSRQSNGLKNSDPTLADTLRDLRDALDKAMGRSISQADKAAWETARKEYSAQKVIEKAASRAGEATAEGMVTPANLRNTVAAENRGMYARGQGPFSELSRAGAAVMAPMPQSGTAPRSALYNIANFASAGALPAAVGRVIMSKPAQSYLSNQVATKALENLSPGQAAVVNAMIAAEQQQRLAAPR
jgi:hypothetical protein